MARIVDRVGFDGWSGVVPEHVPAKPKGRRARRFYGRLPRAEPRAVPQDDPAFSA